MRTRFITLDNAGKAKRAGEGVAFALMPGRAVDAATSQRLGAYPARVRTSDGDVIEVTGPHVYRFGRNVTFEIDRTAADDSGKEAWHLVTFDDENERFEFSSRISVGSLIKSGVPGGGTPSGKQGVAVGAAKSVSIVAGTDYGGSDLLTYVRIADDWWQLDYWLVGNPGYSRDLTIPAGADRIDVRDPNGVGAPIAVTAWE